MKLMLLLAILVGSATLGYAQTTPSAAPATASSSPSVAGTKNVGADRADAPQAPGMSTTPTTAGQLRRPGATGRRAARKSTPDKLPK